jgi:hypothetical protein
VRARRADPRPRQARDRPRGHPRGSLNPRSPREDRVPASPRLSPRKRTPRLARSTHSACGSSVDDGFEGRGTETGPFFFIFIARETKSSLRASVASRRKTSYD